MAAPDIALTTDMEGFFDAAVQRAIAERRLTATAAAVRYVVVLLCDFARPDTDARPVLERPLTLLFREALETDGAERFRRLRRLGDGILYVLGFFGSSVSRRGADRGYVMTVGSSAYRHAAAMQLLRSGVDRSVIALWLGHESIDTTQMYLHADMRLKEKALARTKSTGLKPGRYRPHDALLQFLESL